MSILNTIHRDPTSSYNIKQSLINLSIYNRSNHEKTQIKSIYYRLSTDKRYHYEFRYELNTSNKHRLMLIFGGAKRGCDDMWNLSVGKRILLSLHNSNYSYLVICSKRKTYDINLPISNNSDAKYIYRSLQIWMNTIYYSKFQRYPLLYIHATSRGSRLAGLLCRILPIQAQILYIHPGHTEAMLIPSMYDYDLQTRLQLDPTFANWFYFGFCYNMKNKKQSLCPFENNYHYFYPIPPTFLTFLKNDPFQQQETYKQFIRNIRNKAIELGGIFLTNIETIQLDILSPAKLTNSYMQKHFHPWHSKPYASQLFFEHFTNQTQSNTTKSKRNTCWCSDIDFTYYEIKPSITNTWSNKKYNEYNDYVRDIRVFGDAFCEEVCGDLLTTHAMASRNLKKILNWIDIIDHLRHKFYIDDYLKRPLKIWMYDKKILLHTLTYFSLQEINWMNISKEYQMYSPEYYIQDYFHRLNHSKKMNHHSIQWTMNPLLADYFIIPSDLMFFYFNRRPATLNDLQFKELLKKLNKFYFEILLTNVQTMFPYWTLASQADYIGANHVIAIPGGRNMGILYSKTQNILKNVIQLAFTGIRNDLLPSNASPQYVYRNISITYRHQYDVIIPQYTPLKWNRSRYDNLDILIKKKKRLFYFAGALYHSTSPLSARSLLSYLWKEIKEKQKFNITTQIQGRQFETIMIIDGHIETDEYIESIQSSIFSLCPEGFLPWSPRLYESIQLGAIPILLVDNIVLPFERFIDWRSFSVKINVSNIRNITYFLYRIDKFEKYVKEKLENALSYLHAFEWPYSINKHLFQLEENSNDRVENVFHYISLELRCRRLEQLYGFTVERLSIKSIEAQRLACTNHPNICPCHNEQRSLAFQEYI
ncbi:unnamed protein product [Adineta steineri]|uniref:Exostosin GT47 domain-containing protein n=1 Tax=Adineta steineri TaxID=433720 RepID=A0A815GWG7_9BILA|nr:unnamed protein product [Adineta steineri]